MYIHYIAELSQYSRSLKDLTIATLLADVEKMMTESNLDVYMIEHDDTTVGFFVVGIKSHTHPDTRYFMGEFYIKPEYRQKGVGKEIAKQFFADHPGYWCMFILKSNRSADLFWNKTVKEVGGYFYPLCETGHTPLDAVQYGFEIPRPPTSKESAKRPKGRPKKSS